MKVRSRRAMCSLPWSAARLAATSVCVFAVLTAGRAADPPMAVKSPLSPEESLRHLELASGFEIELAAAEPEIVDPVSIAFDEDGRMYVVEMRDYPTGPKPGEPPLSRITLLEDRDNDGRFETAHLFADKLLFPTGVLPWRGGVIVTLAGEIAYFKDTDGDNKADLRETWFRGFAQENPQLRANHPTFALDNHIYVANGLRGGTIVADEEKWGKKYPPVAIGGKDFRFDPLTGECEAVAGNGQFGMTFDDVGNRFICDNRHPCRQVMLEDWYTKRNPFLAVREVVHDVCAPAERSRIHPLSKAWTTSTLHAGQFTAACGVLIYRGDVLYKGPMRQVFVCEPTGNLVHHESVRYGSAYAVGESVAALYGSVNDRDRDFLASPDEWFRPVDLANGPDGALYVVDMYRAVIEHPDWVPAELKNRPDAWLGNDRGRIYRVVKAQGESSPRPPRQELSRQATADLVPLLEHPTGWHRDTAARLIFERQDRSVAAPLESLVSSSLESRPRDRGTLCALWALEGLGALTDDLLQKAMLQSDRGMFRPAFRGDLGEFALPLLDRRLKSRELAADSPLAQALLEVRSAGVRKLLSIGNLPDSREKEAALALAALNCSSDEWRRRAVWTSLGDRPDLVFGEIVEQFFKEKFFGDESHASTLR